MVQTASRRHTCIEQNVCVCVCVCVCVFVCVSHVGTCRYVGIDMGSGVDMCIDLTTKWYMMMYQCLGIGIGVSIGMGIGIGAGIGTGAGREQVHLYV